MLHVSTQWGELSASTITNGPGGCKGEVHVSHDGTLYGKDKELEKILQAFRPRARQVQLTQSHWVVLGVEGKTLLEALASAAARDQVSSETPAPITA